MSELCSLESRSQSDSMPIETTDVRSNPREQIAHAADVVKKSKDRRKVFIAIHQGKKKIKKVSDIVTATGLHRMRVLQEAGYLANNKIVKKTKLDGELAYEKDDFYSQNKERILSLAGSPKRMETFHTRSNPKVTTQVVVQRIINRMVDTKQLTMDDIESFSKVASVQKTGTNIAIAESTFKHGLQAILGEEGAFQDWGGESDDLFSTRVLVDGARRATAFGLKGRGTKGILYPRMMGKRGDQIQRLFSAPAEVFILQYWGQVDESIYELMKSLATAKSTVEGKRISWGVIDGVDTARLLTAYAEHFTEDSGTKGGD
jgi:hypothetical protein